MDISTDLVYLLLVTGSLPQSTINGEALGFVCGDVWGLTYGGGTPA